MRYVIIGGSIAGIAAAQSIRGRDARADITIITGEQGRAYYRPMIPLLIENSEREIDFLEDPLERYTVNRAHDLAQAVDAGAHEVKLASGTVVPYDRLLIATGARAVIPAVTGLQGPGSFVLRTRDDANGIGEYAQGKREALIIGAGLVGIKAAIALGTVGLKVMLVEQLDRILWGRLDQRGAGIIQTVLDDNGYTVLTGETVKEVIRHGASVTGVTLASGMTMPAELVVIAVGVEPNVSFLEGSGIFVNNGVVINERLETNVPDVFAAGDVVEYIDTVSGEQAVSALWTNAEEMGRFAGMNMAGGNSKYSGFLSTMNATEILDVPFISVGIIEPDGPDYEVVIDDRLDSYRKLVFKDDILQGFVFLGDITSAGIYTNLVRNRIAINELKEEAINGSLEYIDFLRASGVSIATG